MLRLFFADALPAGEALELVRRLREQAEEMDARFRAEIIPLAESADAQGIRFPPVTARWGADYYRWRAEWLARLEADLGA